MGTKNAAMLVRLRTAFRFRRGKDMESFLDVQAGGVIWMVSK